MGTCKSHTNKMVVGNVVLALIRIYLSIFDVLTGWIYNLLYRPGARLKEQRAIRAVPCKPIKPGDTSVTYKPIPIQASALVRDFEHAQHETYLVKRMRSCLMVQSLKS